MDPMFIQNITDASAAGLLVGAYHYLDESVTNPAQARVAAGKFYTAIMAGCGVDLPPVLDYEHKSDSVSPAGASAIALAFLQEIECLTGKRPTLYTIRHSSAISVTCSSIRFGSHAAGYAADRRQVLCAGTSAGQSIWRHADMG
ncbi:GH25 family lysozyme [Paenibacillus bovis]|uniref:Uncharacterized protein n=1 Tax=Paenibacillus bovis TaxID=1616788 RepID=A0A172ZJ68_9BACL|nr:GH25 family lysozyme [Paenibacillus bovis]ANF97442.1 hypothetical protein AR543_16460 [Paenibacillus bovis]